MSIFLYNFKKNEKSKSLEDFELENYLPRPALEEEKEKIGSSEIIIFKYDSALDKPLFKVDNGFMFIQGYLPEKKAKNLYNFLDSEYSVDITNYSEAFCAISAKSNGFSFLSSVTGADQIFYIETNDNFFVTNRHNLLGALSLKLTFRKETFWWMAGRTHVGDEGTYWNEIKRSLPSRHYIYKDGLKCVNPNYKNLFEEIKDNDILDYFDTTVPYFEDIFSDINHSMRLSLTGGKDSRAILGLLSKVTDISNLKINTTGYLYSPDVNSAKDLTEKLGITKNHNITRPKYSQSAFDYAERIANELLVDFLGKSLADMSKISYANDIVLGGHEAGIKSPLNTLSLDRFIQSRKNWCDDQLILSDNARELLNKSYLNKLENSLTDVPIRCYDKIEGLEFRIVNRNSTNITNSHIGGSQIHPFYDGKIIKAVCGISSRAIKAHYIPYYFTSLASGDIVNIPFADTNWPDDLKKFISHNGNINGRNINSSLNHYHFKDYFPTESSFGLSSWRLDLCEMSANNLYSYLISNQDFFDYLNMERVSEIIFKPIESKSFREMYVNLGLLKSVLVHYFDEDILNFSLKKDIIDKIQSFLLGEKADRKIISRENKLEDMLLRYEQSISKMEKEITILNSKNTEDSEYDCLKDYLENGDLDSSSIPNFILKMEDNPVKISKLENTSSKLTGYYFSPDAGNKCAILFFDKDVKNILSNVAYSKNLNAYYKYINVDPSTGRFEVDLSVEDVIDSEINIYIKRWYGTKPVFLKIDM